jgi:UTP--glucose-1-phosphate uridylyltransferase
MIASKKELKAIIPAAGLGTRFLPFTKSVPKELLPLLNKPAIHLIVEEGLGADIHDFIIITSETKQALRQYFIHDAMLEHALQKTGKLDLLAQTNALIDQSSFTFINQPQPLGLGHAIMQAKSAVNDSSFCVMLPDDIILNTGTKNAMQQLITVAQEQQAMVVAVQEVSPDAISSYGSIGIKKQINENLFEIAHIVEKPNPVDAPSCLAVIGRYVFSPILFDALETISPNASHEIQLTDAITQTINQGHRVLAYKFQGSRFDFGSAYGWLQANIYTAMHDPKMAPALRTWLETIL